MTQDEYIELFSLICDGVERGVYGYSDDDGLMHTSKEARAAAVRIFDILDFEVDE